MFKKIIKVPECNSVVKCKKTVLYMYIRENLYINEVMYYNVEGKTKRIVNFDIDFMGEGEKENK